MRAKLLSAAACGAFLALTAQACGDSNESGPTPAAAGDSSAGERASHGGTGATPSAGGVAGEDATVGGSENHAGTSSSGSGGDAAIGGDAASGGDASGGGAAACPQGPTGKAPSDYLAQFASGTRLKAHYYKADGLPDTFLEFFDSKLGVTCDFVTASDGKLRCLPRSTAVISAYGYSDSECSTTIVTVSHACAIGTGSYIRQTAGCLDKFAVYATKAFKGSQYFPVPGGCSKSEAAPPDAVIPGDEVAPSNFVEGSLTSLPGICQASLRVVQTADGARGPFEAYDIATNAGCNTRNGRCEPQRLVYAEPSLFTDALCKKAVTQHYASSRSEAACTPPDFVLDSSVQVAGQPTVYSQVGPLAPALYSGIGSCQPALDKPWIESLYEISDQTATLAPLASQLLGNARLQMPVVGEQGTPLIALSSSDPQLHDATLASLCFLRQLDDGTVRCIPTDTGGGSLVDEYSDVDCKVHVRRCSGDQCVGSYVYDTAPDAGKCSSERPTSAIWRIKAAATAYYRGEPGSCYPGGDVGTDMWTVEAVAPATLGAASLETAP